MNSTTIAMACEGISKALNRVLEYDPQTPQKLSPLAGKSLLIESTAPHFTVSLVFTENQIIIMPSDEYSAPAMLSGTAPALIRLLMSGEIKAAEKCAVEVSDEDSLIPTLLSLSREIGIDWEALLAEHTGDVAAHLIGESFRKAQQLQQDILSRSKSGWATYEADNGGNKGNSTDGPDSTRKSQSPLDVIGAQLKALLP